jgi:hypothetical protein
MNKEQIAEQLETELIILSKWIDNPEISDKIKYGKIGFCYGMLAVLTDCKPRKLNIKWDDLR